MKANAAYGAGLNPLIYAEKTIFSVPLPTFQLWMIASLCCFSVIEMS